MDLVLNYFGLNDSVTPTEFKESTTADSIDPIEIDKYVKIYADSIPKCSIYGVYDIGIFTTAIKTPIKYTSDNILKLDKHNIKLSNHIEYVIAHNHLYIQAYLNYFAKYTTEDNFTEYLGYFNYISPFAKESDFINVSYLLNNNTNLDLRDKQKFNIDLNGPQVPEFYELDNIMSPEYTSKLQSKTSAYYCYQKEVSLIDNIYISSRLKSRVHETLIK